MKSIILDTELFGPLEAEIINGVVQLFANQLVTAWREITEAEDCEDGKRNISFSASIVDRKIEGSIKGAKKFTYKDIVFVEDPAQAVLGLDEDETAMEISVNGGPTVKMTKKDLTDRIKEDFRK